MGVGVCVGGKDLAEDLAENFGTQKQSSKNEKLVSAIMENWKK